MPAGAEDAKEEIRARAKLEEIVREHVRLRVQGRQLLGLCPFHSEKTPSFRVTPETQTWHCFGCDKGGDVFTFVELIEKTDFRGALEMLAERTGVELVKLSPADRERQERRKRILEINRLAQQYYEFLLWNHDAGAGGRELLERRGVSQEVAKRFGLGFAPTGERSLAEFLRKREKSALDADEAGLVRRGRDFFRNRLMIPIRDERGETVAFVGRTVADDPRKYLNSPETAAYHKGRVLFALDLAREGIGKSGHAVLMEGQFDVIVGHQFGVANAIASSGTALTEEQLRLLRRFTEEIVLCFDADSAGRAAALRAIDLAAAAGLRTRVMSVSSGKDPDEFLRGGGDWDAALQAAMPEWEFAIRDAIGPLNPAQPDELDKALGRVRPVLERIPEPAVREAYGKKTAQWLGIEERYMRRRPSAPQPASASGGRQARRSVGEHVIALLVAYPEQVSGIAAVISPDDFGDGLRDSYLKIAGTLTSAGQEGLREALDSLGEREQEMVRRAWADPPPELDPSALEDLAHGLRLETRKAELRSVKSRLAEAEERGDRDRVALLVVEDGRLAREVEALKNSRKGAQRVFELSHRG